MKKTVLFLFLSLVMVGCKPSNDNPPEGGEGTIQEASQIVATAKYGNCGKNLIVIDASKTDSTWKAKNEKYFCDLVLTNREEKHTHDYFIVNLGKVSSFSNIIGKWLQDNTKLICYEESYKFIEGDHIIELSADDMDRLPLSNKRELSFKDLKLKINNFDVLFYENFIQFSLPNDVKDPIQVSVHSKFDQAKNLYSIPLFKSIAYNRKLTDNATFIFYDGDDSPSEQLVVFGVRDSPASPIMFYDISVNPKSNPKKPIVL